MATEKNYPRICIRDSNSKVGDVTCDVVDSLESSLLCRDKSSNDSESLIGTVKRLQSSSAWPTDEAKKPRQTISKGHKNYDLMLNLQLGIRVGLAVYKQLHGSWLNCHATCPKLPATSLLPWRHVKASLHPCAIHGSASWAWAEVAPFVASFHMLHCMHPLHAMAHEFCEPCLAKCSDSARPLLRICLPPSSRPPARLVLRQCPHTATCPPAAWHVLRTCPLC
ncbi:hypothetical protein ZIOFF_047501 [Zingiber officinale]|uniref:Uncharacterized protein n=1 Tax=Zingiber officinale TaxID=94328 RepID=A0A8J5FN37_ZINOF|nr:hypothetical protein ZIOFF_047501 [Zingiber officinale]